MLDLRIVQHATDPGGHLLIVERFDELQGHRRATKEVDRKNPLTAARDRPDTDYDYDHGNAGSDKAFANKVDRCLAHDAEHFQDADTAGTLGQFEHHPTAENGGVHTHHDSQDQRDGKSSNLIGADHVQHECCNQGGQVGIDDRDRGPTEAVTDGHPE